jgi:hypothetical protein
MYILYMPVIVADPDPGSGTFLIPGSGSGKKSGSGFGIRDESSRSFFRELRNSFFGLKIIKFFDADPDPGSGIFISWIQDGEIQIRDPA